MNWDELREQVQPKRVNVVIKRPHAKDVTIPMVPLTYFEWISIDLEVNEPAIPRTIVAGDGTKLPNKEDAAYRMDMARVNMERSYRRLLLALKKAGVEVPGHDAREKIETLQKDIDSGIANALLSWLAQAAMGGKAEVERQAENFRAGDDPAHASAAPLPNTAVTVVGAA